MRYYSIFYSALQLWVRTRYDFRSVFLCLFDDEVVLSVFDVRNTHETRTQELRLCYGEDKDAEVSF